MRQRPPRRLNPSASLSRLPPVLRGGAGRNLGCRWLRCGLAGAALLLRTAGWRCGGDGDSPAKIAHCPAADCMAGGCAGWLAAGGVVDCSSGLAPGVSSGCGLGNCTGRITPVVVLSVGSFSPGSRRLGGAAGACLSGSVSTSPSLMVRVFDCAVNTGEPLVSHHARYHILGEDLQGSPFFGTSTRITRLPLMRTKSTSSGGVP